MRTASCHKDFLWFPSCQNRVWAASWLLLEIESESVEERLAGLADISVRSRQSFVVSRLLMMAYFLKVGSLIFQM